MTVTYKKNNGDDYQSPFSFNTIGEMLAFFGDNEEVEFLINCEISEVEKLLRGFRIAKGKTLQQVADGMEANYDRHVISNIESGKRKLGLRTLVDLAQSMGMTVEITFKGKCDFVKELPYESDEYDDLELSDFEKINNRPERGINQ